MPRRPLNGRLPLLRLLSAGAKPILRWDETFIKPVDDAARRCVREIEKFLPSSVEISLLLENDGDTLIIDNWRMLHGRSAVPQLAQSRVIERIYLDEIK